jgi:hypothetical protein
MINIIALYPAVSEGLNEIYMMVSLQASAIFVIARPCKGTIKSSVFGIDLAAARYILSDPYQLGSSPILPVKRMQIQDKFAGNIKKKPTPTAWAFEKGDC